VSTDNEVVVSVRDFLPSTVARLFSTDPLTSQLNVREDFFGKCSAVCLRGVFFESAFTCDFVPATGNTKMKSPTTTGIAFSALTLLAGRWESL